MKYIVQKLWTTVFSGLKKTLKNISTQTTKRQNTEYLP